MEKTKWVLPSEEMTKSYMDRKGMEGTVTAVARYIQAESDLTDALELLEEVGERSHLSVKVMTFLSKFRQPK